MLSWKIIKCIAIKQIHFKVFGKKKERGRQIHKHTGRAPIQGSFSRWPLKEAGTAPKVGDKKSAQITHMGDGGTPAWATCVTFQGLWRQEADPGAKGRYWSRHPLRHANLLTARPVLDPKLLFCVNTCAIDMPEVFKYSNESKTYENLQNIVKVTLRGKYILIKSCIIWAKPKISYWKMYLWKLENRVFCGKSKQLQMTCNSKQLKLKTRI